MLRKTGAGKQISASNLKCYVAYSFNSGSEVP